jgi:phthalate 4,5-dioxygenase
LQAMEVGIDPAHASFLHRFFEDEDVSASYGKQFRAASADSDWPMTRVLREFESPEISVEATDYGMRLTALRRLSETLMHVRVTNQLFPQAFVIPLSSDTTITQWHLPVDDTHTYWVAIFTSFGKPLDKGLMREQRLKLYSLPDYMPRVGKHDHYGFNPIEQLNETYTGMGHDINVHDQWAVESQGEVQDRTKEHLGTTDKAIIANRRQLSHAIDTVEKGETRLMAFALRIHGSAIGVRATRSDERCVSGSAPSPRRGGRGRGCSQVKTLVIVRDPHPQSLSPREREKLERHIRHHVRRHRTTHQSRQH